MAFPDLQRGFNVREGLYALGVEIVGADDFAVAVNAHLAGNENKLRCLHASEVRILPERLAERVRIENLDIGHRRLILLNALRQIHCGVRVIPPVRRSP